MIAILYTVYFALGGLMVIRKLFPEKKTLTRLWLGLSLGLLAEMWLPALAASFLRFSIQAHIAAAFVCLFLVALVFFRYSHPMPALPAKEDDDKFVRMFWLLVIPFTVLSGYLQWTHMLMPASDGSYWCGQSTYGDLCMHLSFATSLRNAAFPPKYNLLYGTSLAYPYLTDSLSTTFLLMGTPINLSVIIPGTYLMFLTYAGFILLARRILGNRPLTITAAFLFFFLNGGLGFLYDFDLSFRDHFERVQEIFTGYYKTPANQPDLNLRFSNVIADLMIPQRSLLGGWAMVLPAFHYLIDTFEKRQRKTLILLSLTAGALPLIHTHTFLALGLFSGGYILSHLITSWHERGQVLKLAGIYLVLVLILALPQLLGNAIRQTVEGGSMRIQFNWVNNSGNRGFIDGYIWFWIKNAGLPYILMLCAVLNCRRRGKLDIVLGMMAIYAVAEIVIFQPNEYDNNKLFYLWYVFATMLAADYGSIIVQRLDGLRGRALICAFFFFGSLFSGTLSIMRETVSNYQLFSASAVDAGEWIENNTDSDSVFMTGQQHINPVCSLAGRQIICGSNLYVFFHGLNYQEQQADCVMFYASPEKNRAILEKYQVDYIYESDYERAEMIVDVEGLREHYELVYEKNGVRIYKSGL
ncbi:MAG: hypothetical protein IJT77_08020 [Clostridia bacterium]|nr:hypothetical protein [Clostridia bacterium]